MDTLKITKAGEYQRIVLGGGCFWCLESAFSHIKGVVKVSAGYAGGVTKKPTYEEVSSGSTGHAEVVELIYKPSIIDIEILLKIFFTVHNPTSKNRQGNDIGTQYRSIILYNYEPQRQVALHEIARLEAEKIYADPIVTELKILDEFYLAEEEHQRYYEKNPGQAYCQIVIAPKLTKLRETFGEYFYA